MNGGTFMFLEVSEKDKIAYYWLSKEEKADDKLRASLQPQYKDWNKKGYAVCTFLSGTGDLVELTKELLIHNKEVIAEQRVRKQRERER